MYKKWTCCAALVGLLIVPALAPAQDAGPPTVVGRLRSFDALIQTAKVMAKAVDKEEVGNQLEQLIKAQTGPNGLDGIDTKRPLGFYGKMGGDLSDVAGVLMIPISNEKAFLKLLANLDYKAAKNEDGVYIINQFQIPVDIGFRFANKYAYVTGLNFDAIAKKNLLSPAKVFPRNEKSLASATLFVNQIPKALRDLAIAKMEEELEKAKKEEKPGESKTERKIRLAAIDATGEIAADFLLGATEVSMRFDVDAKNQKIKSSFFIDGKKNSRLKAHIRALAGGPSLFGGLVKKGTASSLVHIKLPKNVKKIVDQAVEQGIIDALAKEQNPVKRRHAEAILKALKPTFTSGELDTAQSIVTHDDKQVTFIAGVKVVGGQNILETVRKLAKELLPGDQQLLKLNAAKIGKVAVHRLNVQGSYDEKAKQLLGDNPVLIAVRDNAIFVAAGKNGMAALRRAVTAKPRAAPVVDVQVEVAKLVQLIDQENQRQAAKKVFGKGGKKGAIRFTVNSDKSLRIRVEMDLSVLEFGAAVQGLNQGINFQQPRSLIRVEAK